MRAQRAYEKFTCLTGSWISSAADRVDLGSWVLSEDWILDLGHPRQAGSWILAGGLKNRVRGISERSAHARCGCAVRLCYARLATARSPSRLLHAVWRAASAYLSRICRATRVSLFICSARVTVSYSLLSLSPPGGLSITVAASPRRTRPPSRRHAFLWLRAACTRASLPPREGPRAAPANQQPRRTLNLCLLPAPSGRSPWLARPLSLSVGFALPSRVPGAGSLAGPVLALAELAVPVGQPHAFPDGRAALGEDAGLHTCHAHAMHMPHT